MSNGVDFTVRAKEWRYQQCAAAQALGIAEGRNADIDAHALCRKGVETNFFPLWEYDTEVGLHFTNPTDDPLPLEAYIGLMGKYRHLDDEQKSTLQRRIDEQLRTLHTFVQPREPAQTAG